MIRINLIRKIEPRPTRRPRLPAAIAALTAAALASVHVIQASALSSLEETHAELATAVKSLRASVEAVRAPRPPEPPPSTSRLDAASCVRRLRALAAAAPANLWIEAYRRHGAAVTIEGLTNDDAAIESFARRLSTGRGFQRLEITETTLRERDREPDADTASRLYHFTLIAEVTEAVAGSVERLG